MAHRQTEEYHTRGQEQRRITADPRPPHDNLKEIAGRLQKLTYSEMNKLASMVWSEVDGENPVKVAEGLLAIAEKILSEPSR